MRKIKDLSLYELKSLDYLVTNYQLARDKNHDIWHLLGNAIRFLLDVPDEDKLAKLITIEFKDNLRTELRTRK